MSIFLLSSLVSASALGFTLGVAGQFIFGGLSTTLKGLTLAVTTFLYGAHELGFLKMPTPHFRRQVPKQWPFAASTHVNTILWGLEIGVGFLTHVQSALYFAMLVGVFVWGTPSTGVLVLSTYALCRTLLTPGMSAFVRTDEMYVTFLRRFSPLYPRVQLASAAAACLLGAYLLTSNI